MKTKHHGQMSESFLTAVFLSLSGGLQDAYTYLFRGKVFANAQTGNIVLLSANIMDGRWDKVLHYLVPLCAFALGVLVAEKMREQFQAMQRLHWRQLVVLGEVLLLFAVGFLPQSQNLLANAIVSFSCAMQVQAFRKVDGYAFASTMCIGDLRSGVEAFCIWRKTHEPHAKDRMVRYFGIILLFALGAGLGRVSALLAQAENSARPSREITTRVQVFFNAVRLLAAIVCRSGGANVRQLFPASDDQPWRSRERMRPQMRLVTSPASWIRRGSLSISRRWSILPEMALIK